MSIRSLLPISALLLGSALLLFAGGLNALVLPVRGAAEGFTSFSLGLLGTGWAIGYVAGCLRVPVLVAKAGHIRAFSVMAALAAISILASLLMISPWAWIPLRALAGFCFAGAAMIVESWLNERTDAASRGRVFGLYTMVTLAASTAGQMALTLGNPNSDNFFIVGAIFYCLALVPLAITTSATPMPLVSVRLDLKALWRNSPVAVFAVMMVGCSNSAFGALAAVYAGKVGLHLTGIALFASIPVLAGAVSQLPVGIVSDRLDRRSVLAGLATLSLLVDLSFIVLMPETRTMNLVAAAAYGAGIFAMYPVIIAHANDHAEPGAFIQTSGGLLMVFGLGSIVGPLAAGVLMSIAGPLGLFMTSIFAHGLIVFFTIWRMTLRAAPTENKGSFQVSAPGRILTPETALLAAEESEAEAEIGDAEPVQGGPLIELAEMGGDAGDDGRAA